MFGRNRAGKLVFLSRFAVSMTRDGRKDEESLVMEGKEFGQATLVKPRQMLLLGKCALPGI